MENKQLFEKQGNGYNPFFPIVRLEDIIETITDKSIQWIFNNYNHIYVEYSESKAITRNKVPSLLRRKGLWITYNVNNELITEYFKGDNKDVTNYTDWTHDENWERFDKLNFVDGSITYQHLSEAVKQLLGSGNTITNYPDDEDLTVKDGTLKLKDRDYDVANFSGLGRIILRKNIMVTDKKLKNILSQNMINKENTIYEIRYDFDLNGAEITIPEGCVLDFQGGSLSNGILKGNNINVIGIAIFDCLFINNHLKASWFKDSKFIESIAYLENYNNVVLEIDKDIELNNNIVLPSNTKIKSNKKNIVKIKTDSLETIVFKDNVYINGVCFVGDDNVLINNVLTVKGNNVTIESCKFENLYGSRTFVIYSPWNENEYTNLKVISCVFDGYGCIDETGEVGDESGASRAIYTRSVCGIDISGNEFRNQIGRRDGDAIHLRKNEIKDGYLYPHENATVNYHYGVLNANVINNVFTNIAKSAVKFFGSNISILDNYIKSDIDCGFLFVRGYRCENIIIANNIVKSCGKYDFLAHFYNCKDLYINNNFIQNDNTETFINAHAITFHECLNVKVTDFTINLTGGCVEFAGINTALALFKLNRTKNIYIENSNFTINDYHSIINTSDKEYGELVLNNTKFDINKKQVPFYITSENTDYKIIFDNIEIVNQSGNLSNTNATSYIIIKSDKISINSADIDIKNTTALFTAKYIDLTNIKTNLGGIGLKNVEEFNLKNIELYPKENSSYSFFEITGINEYRGIIEGVNLNKTYRRLFSCSNNFSYLSISNSNCLMSYPWTDYFIIFNGEGGKTIKDVFWGRLENKIQNITYGPTANKPQNVLSGFTYFSIDENVVYTEYEGYSLKTNGPLSYSSLGRPSEPIRGFQYFDINIGKPVWWNGIDWVESNGDAYNLSRNGTFSEKPVNVNKGFQYFCTDRKTVEGTTNGIMIYHKGNNVWIDALGRVVE